MFAVVACWVSTALALISGVAFVSYLLRSDWLMVAITLVGALAWTHLALEFAEEIN